MNNIKSREFILLMAALMSLTAFSIDAVLPAFPFIRQAFHLTTNHQLQLTVLILFLGMTIGTLIYGALSEIYGRKLTLLIGLSIFLIGSILVLCSTSFDTMITGRFIQGLGSAAPRILCTAIIRDQFEGPEMAKILSIILAVFIFVPVIAPTIGQLIVYHFNWRALFAFYVLLALALLFWSYFRLSESLKPTHKKSWQSMSLKNTFLEVLSHKSTVLYTLCSGLIFGFLVGYISITQQLYFDYFSISKSFPIYFALSALSLGISSFFNSKLLDRFTMEQVCQTTFITLFIEAAVFLIYLLSISTKVSLIIFMIYMTSTFFLIGLLFSNLNTLAMHPLAHIAGIAASAIAFAQSMISLVIGSIIGFYYHGDVVLMVNAMTLLSLLGIFIVQQANRGTLKAHHTY